MQTTKNIAGIAQVELTEDEVKDARLALAHFASKWVDDIAVNIMANADEIIANPAIRMMVVKWHESETRYQHKRRNALLQMGLSNSDPMFTDLDNIESLYHRDAKKYSEVLYDLLCC